MSIVRPGRLVMIKCGFCDFCNQVCTKCNKAGMYEVNGRYDEFLGWQYCGCQECLDRLAKSKAELLYPYESLKKEFGDNFKVLRSSGVLQKGGWTICGDGVKGDKDFGILLKNQKEEIEKLIPLNNLREWNSVNYKGKADTLAPTKKSCIVF